MIIKQKKGHTVGLLVIVLLFFAVFLLAFLIKMENDPDEYSFWIDNALGYYGLKVACLLFAILLAVVGVWLVKQLFSKEPLIEICDAYFYDHSSAISLGKISWSDMERAYMKGGFLNIELKNPEKYLSKKNWLQKLMIKANLKLGYGEVCISIERFKKEAQEFYIEFAKRMAIGEK